MSAKHQIFELDALLIAVRASRGGGGSKNKRSLKVAVDVKNSQTGRSQR